MKGFIEVHDKNSGDPITVNVKNITWIWKQTRYTTVRIDFPDKTVRIDFPDNSYFDIKESYEEVKQKISDAL